MLSRWHETLSSSSFYSTCSKPQSLLRRETGPQNGQAGPTKRSGGIILFSSSTLKSKLSQVVTRRPSVIVKERLKGESVCILVLCINVRNKILPSGDLWHKEGWGGGSIQGCWGWLWNKTAHPHWCAHLQGGGLAFVMFLWSLPVVSYSSDILVTPGGLWWSWCQWDWPWAEGG